jgi:hypothetical protein
MVGRKINNELKGTGRGSFHVLIEELSSNFLGGSEKENHDEPQSGQAVC